MAVNVITILGPTATGKTRLAALLCSAFGGEIISCDSRQFYRGMDIGTGKDYADYFVDGNPIPCHLIDFLNPDDDYDVFHFQNDFRDAFTAIANRQHLPFLVGGSGLYLSSVLQEYRFVPVSFAGERFEELTALTEDELRQILLAKENRLHNTTDLIEKERLIKAILLAEAGPEHSSGLPKNTISPLILGIFPGREVVKERISRRLSQRLSEGMIDEVAGLLAGGVRPERLKFFGLEYRSITSFLEGEITRDEMQEQLRFAIFNFAKRQMTWFRRMEKQGVEIKWLQEPFYEHAFEEIQAAVTGKTR
jgi:tRNA dimethylallyltransferase